MGPYTCLCVLMDSSGSFCVLIVPYGSSMVLKDPVLCLWILMVSCGSVYVLIRPFGF